MPWNVGTKGASSIMTATYTVNSATDDHWLFCTGDRNVNSPFSAGGSLNRVNMFVTRIK